MREPFTNHTPVDDIEPLQNEDAYRAAAQRLASVLNSAMLTLLQNRCSMTSFWQIALALGLPICAGRSMDKIADELGVERATFSKGAKQFQRMNGLPPSAYMRSESAVQSYYETRTEQL